MNDALKMELQLLKAQLAELGEENARLAAENEQLESAKMQLEGEKQDLESQVAWLKQQLFGRRSERFREHPGQTLLFEHELSEEAIREIEKSLAGEPEEEDTFRRRRRRGPKRLPADLPREDRLVDVPDEEKLCDHGHARVKVDEKITEELEIIPGRMKVIRYIQPIYATPDCFHPDCRGSTSGALPWRPIEEGRPGTGLLAHVAVSKYGDHLPLYRQSQMFAREGIDLSRSTLCGWVMRIADLLAPIVEEMKRQLLARSYLQADETTIRVLKAPVRDKKSGKSRLAYLWGYGVPGQEVVYDFTLDRSQKNPLRFLANFKGYLQIDGYDGYNGLFLEGEVVRLGCFAHVRRKFHHALKDSKEEARTVLAAIQLLYRLEREMKLRGCTPVERTVERQRVAKPVLEKLNTLLWVYKETALPKSRLGKATTYALNEWKFLERYVDVGEAEIDNNSIEQTLRPVAIGRKNYLFAGSPSGGRAAAVLYSLVTSCKRLKLNPWDYLKDVLERISTHPNSRIAELTPGGWMKAPTVCHHS